MIPAIVPHPGEILKKELQTRGWSCAEFAEMINHSTRSIELIISGKRGITGKTAGEIARLLGTSFEFWLNLQANYNAWKLRKEILACPIHGLPILTQYDWPTNGKMFAVGYVLECKAKHIKELSHTLRSVIKKWNEALE